MNKLSNKFFRLSIQELESKLSDSGADNIFTCIKSIETGANKIASWSLSVLGGSILALLSSSYLHPDNSKIKLFYFLFAVGWICLALSLYYSKEILGSSIAADLYKGKREKLLPIFSRCNKCYKHQLNFFNLALLFFGFWLVIYLGWWIFGNELIIFLNF